MPDLKRMEIRANRERLARKQAEKLLEDKSRELYYINKELEQIKNSLECTVIERTQELEDKVTELTLLKRELTSEKNRAEEASALKSRFVATVSHEIRTPLNGIMGGLELLREENLSDKAASLVAMASNSGIILNTLLNDILDFSKYEDRKFTLDQEVFSARDFLNSLQSFWYPHCDAKNIILDINLDPDLPDYYLGDPGRLRQVLNNFISNALKYAGSPRLIIHIRADKTPQSTTIKKTPASVNKLAVELAVEDFGVGISTDQQSKLFKAFSQLNPQGTSDFGSGTGLGLAICKQLARVMQGQTGVDSEEGAGSLFWLRIPLTTADVPQKQATDTVKDPIKFSELLGYTPRILVVEDVMTNQILVKIMLESLGVHVATAANGAEALEAAQNRSFDLILMDIGLPDSNGLTITDKIISNPVNPNHQTPIVAFTAHGMAEDLAEFKKAGMCAIVTKPAQKQDLYQVLAQQLPRKSF